MIEDLRIRNLSEGTQESYIRQIAASARYFARSPEELGPEHVRAWQVHLVEERGLSWSALNVAVCALRCLYSVTLGKDWTIKYIPYAKGEKALPVVLSPAEVQRFLDAVTKPNTTAPVVWPIWAPSRTDSLGSVERDASLILRRCRGHRDLGIAASRTRPFRAGLRTLREDAPEP